MLSKLPTLKFLHSANSAKLTIIVHGASEGIDSDFISELINKCYSNSSSVLAIQMPFKDRGESQSSGQELKEELEALSKALEFVDYKSFTSLYFVGKSLGGIILSRFLDNDNSMPDIEINFCVLGFITGDTIIPRNINSIKIIQGEFDKYGSLNDVNSNMNRSKIKNKELHIIKHADHSYRNSNKEPEYYNEAVRKVVNL